MEPNRRISVSIPDDLNDVIQQGIARGRKAAARRAHARRLAMQSACSLALVLVLLVGGINVSPTFAAAVEDVPVLGQLVRIFGKNEPVVEGGVQTDGGSAALTMERRGDTEEIRLAFQQSDASLYQAVFSSYPKTITVTLPGTSGVEILSEISRAGDTSQYIKSVCLLPTSTQDTSIIQLELESDADVQIEEYRDPGSLVIRLTPADIQLDTIYSVRTLSFDSQEIPEIAAQYTGDSTRLLRDDSGKFFLELAQYTTQEEAEHAAASFPGDVIVETRTGNNVPVCYQTLEDYKSSQLLDQYYQLLITSTSAEPILDFLDEHFANAAPQEQDEMLRGLTGFFEDADENEDWDRAAAYYRLAGQEVPEQIQQHIQK